MNNLPFELYPFILRELHLYDLIRLRRLSKRFKFIIDDFYYLIKELIIVDYGERCNERCGCDNLKNKWFFNFELELISEINSNYSIGLDLFEKKNILIFENEISNLKLLRNLRKLKLIYKPNEDCSSNLLLSTIIIKFKKLELLHLDFHSYGKIPINSFFF